MERISAAIRKRYGGGSVSNYGVVTSTSAIIKSNIIGASFGIWTGGGASPEIYNNIINAPSFGIINNNASQELYLFVIVMDLELFV